MNKIILFTTILLSSTVVMAQSNLSKYDLRYDPNGNCISGIKGPEGTSIPINCETGNTVMAFTPKPTNIYFSSSLIIAGSMELEPGDTITIYPDGSVKFGPKYKGGESIKDFWREFAEIYKNIYEKK